MEKINNKITNWDDHLDNKYGKIGTASRDKFELEFESFKIGVLIQEARKKHNLTQTQLAEKVGISKNSLSKIENNSGDIRLSILMRIVNDGFGGNMKLLLNI